MSAFLTNKDMMKSRDYQEWLDNAQLFNYFSLTFAERCEANKSLNKIHASGQFLSTPLCGEVIAAHADGDRTSS
jgi:hypothetical protein